MSDEQHMEAAARHAEATVGWTALQAMRGMPLDQVMEDEDAAGGTCEFCGVNPSAEVKGVRAEAFERVFLYLFADGEAVAWELVAKRAYAIAKAFFPHLLVVRDRGGREHRLSLEDLGHVFDEANPTAARARWSARVQNIVTKPLRANGSNAIWRGAKSPSACEKYREAQQGNQNRKGKGSGQGAGAGGQ